METRRRLRDWGMPLVPTPPDRGAVERSIVLEAIDNQLAMADVSNRLPDGLSEVDYLLDCRLEAMGRL